MATPFEKLLTIKDQLPSNDPESQKNKKGERRKGNFLRDKPQRGEGSENAGSFQGKTEASAIDAAESDAALFLKEMDGVVPLNKDKERVGPSPQNKKISLGDEFLSEDEIALAQLRNLVNGEGDFDFSFTDEYIEGYSKGLPFVTREALKNGRFPIEDKLDLHGLTLAEAKEQLRKFFHKSAFDGKRNVLVIHGRGLRSPDKIPVIKSNLQIHLLKNPLKKYILAFVTALPSDGGFGAIYVLLKKHSRINR
jgi:DNA-nicking Smr family endonuclease